MSVQTNTQNDFAYNLAFWAFMSNFFQGFVGLINLLVAVALAISIYSYNVGLLGLRLYSILMSIASLLLAFELISTYSLVDRDIIKSLTDLDKVLLWLKKISLVIGIVAAAIAWLASPVHSAGVIFSLEASLMHFALGIAYIVVLVRKP